MKNWNFEKLRLIIRLNYWLTNLLIDYSGATKVKMGSTDGQAGGQDSFHSKVSNKKVLKINGSENLNLRRMISSFEKKTVKCP